MGALRRELRAEGIVGALGRCSGSHWCPGQGVAGVVSGLGRGFLGVLWVPLVGKKLGVFRVLSGHLGALNRDRGRG